ncbi:hypothetical protein CR513_15388, partial [Mucuna pruriens]
MIDAANGGALMDKMPIAVRHLISNMTSNTHQFGIRGADQLRMANEIGAVDNLRLENQLTKLTLLVVTNMGSNLIKVGHLIISSLESNHSGQGRVRDHVHLNDSDLPLMTSRSSTTDSTISNTTVPVTITIKNASSRPFTISGGPDEAVSNWQPGVLANHEFQQHAVSIKYERHNSRPQDANRTISQYCEQLQSEGSNNLPS